MRRELLAVQVQGGVFNDLRAESARAADGPGRHPRRGGSGPSPRAVPIRGTGSRPSRNATLLRAECVVHLFGAGHPMTFPWPLFSESTCSTPPRITSSPHVARRPTVSGRDHVHRLHQRADLSMPPVR